MLRNKMIHRSSLGGAVRTGLLEVHSSFLQATSQSSSRPTLLGAQCLELPHTRSITYRKTKKPHGNRLAGAMLSYDNKKHKFLNRNPADALPRYIKKDLKSQDNPRHKRRREIIQGDGLMGAEGYEIDFEARKSMKFEDLLPETENGEGEKESLNKSLVTVDSLAEKKVLSLPLVNALKFNRTYTNLTPVQARTLLPILQNKCTLVRAKTGTGKTAAFAIPIIQKILEKDNTRGKHGYVSAVVVTPTRELAQQVANEFEKILAFGGLSHIRVGLFVGGVSQDAQLDSAGFFSLPVSPPDILVCTPGRLRAILDEKVVRDTMRFLDTEVYDEADTLLDIGFADTLFEIRSRFLDYMVPGSKLSSLLFSATANRAVREFANKQFSSGFAMIDTVSKDEPTTNEMVQQSTVDCSNWAELITIAAQDLLTTSFECKEEGLPFKAIVFLPTKAMVDFVEEIFARITDVPGLQNRVLGLHGGKSQAVRQRRADKFRANDSGVLVTTDVVARGLDFPGVTHVFQLGVPGNLEGYIHRIGRTARAGNTGHSTLFLTPELEPFVRKLKNLKINLKRRKVQVSPTLADDVLKTSQTITKKQPKDVQTAFASLFGSALGVAPIYGLDLSPMVDSVRELELFTGLKTLDIPQMMKIQKARRNSKSFYKVYDSGFAPREQKKRKRIIF